MPQAIWSTDDVRHPRPGGFGDHVLRIRCERYTNQVNTNEDYLERMGLAQGTDRDSAAVRGIVSIWFAGFAIGSIMVGYYTDYIGRLKTIQLGCVWAILGGALQCSAQDISWMMFARIIGGQ